MALDNDIKNLLDSLQKKGDPPYSSFTPTELRKKFNKDFSKKEKPEAIEVASIKEYDIPSIDGLLKCRVYYPNKENQGELSPALMYFHGGGFVIRDNMDIYDQTCRMMCAGANCIVIAVDFRLAPEHPFPAAPEDCYTATCWAKQHAKELNINLDYFGVWGESCGGNLATVVAMMARDRGGPKLCCQIIITAMLDNDFQTQSYIENGQGDYFLTEDSMRWFWNHYISDKTNAKNSYCFPSQSSNFTKLPKALVISAEYDPLRDEDERYANLLKSAGVDTTYICYPGIIHGFFDLYLISKQANKACKEIINLTKEMLI